MQCAASSRPLGTKWGWMVAHEDSVWGIDVPPFWKTSERVVNCPRRSKTCMRQYVIVNRGRFGTQVDMILDLDIMVKVGYQHKRVS